jgi:iron complex transport system ATP-binding protein
MMLRARGVGVRIGDEQLLDGVDLDLRPGKLTAIVGPNGAGKSTLLSVLSGEHRPTSGVVDLEGIALERIEPRELARRRAYLRQSFSLWVDLDVIDVVLLGRIGHPGRGLSREDRRIAGELLDEVGLPGFANRRHASLSGGEQQRVHLARVLAQLGDEGRVLLLDEPSASLDPRLAHDVLALVERRVRRGLAAVAVLHDLSLALRYADELVALARGRVVANEPSSVFPVHVIERVFDVHVEELAPRDGRRRWWLEPRGAEPVSRTIGS